MSDIPTFIEFTANNDGQESTQSNDLLSELDSLDLSIHDDESELDMHDEAANITAQDLADLKAMVQQMKANPSLIVSKCTLNELKSSLTTQKTVGTMTTGTTRQISEDISPPPRMRETIQDCMGGTKKGMLSTFPRLPVP